MRARRIIRDETPRDAAGNVDGPKDQTPDEPLPGRMIGDVTAGIIRRIERQRGRDCD
ncbi:MAG: hypothetical protein Dbin4_02940 [Alphaproteobacteria bacterium]|nr:hypothetical protein [Alphaproteobacteria bacterium]